MPKSLTLVLLLLTVACATPGPPTQPNDREWGQLSADYQWLDNLRNAQPQPPANASRKQQIELMLANLQKIEPVYISVQGQGPRVLRAHPRPPRGQVMAREKIILGDQYLSVSPATTVPSTSTARRSQFDPEQRRREIAHRRSPSSGATSRCRPSPT